MPEFRCISIDQPYAYLIAVGAKTIEVRSWKTRHRGPLVIAATARSWSADTEEGTRLTLPGGLAVGIVDLVDVRPFLREDVEAAYMLEEDYEEGYFAWVLEKARPIRPFPIRGQQGLYRCTFDPEYITPDELDALLVKETPSSGKSRSR
ncbi:ASCH domain-containing protein [Hydrogenibacillus sp. N12]|uniref:ASCH domain-containing protein n=1 Tax=Hydrogenibacillus sp. N12 TaxID=2866627 RepID=UPI001C7D5221|nr:ASCH domain-containing protein [Hydrogenibacillus sp. N12]QZA33231.1 ASCH domain-containing protein [Hydrogenibacillus sp. N12]